jgi:trk system potassium uptake protein TrkA
LLEEANIRQADAVLVTDDDKTNLLAAVHKGMGCRWRSVDNDPTLVPLMGPLDIDAYMQSAVRDR